MLHVYTHTCLIVPICVCMCVCVCLKMHGCWRSGIQPYLIAGIDSDVHFSFCRLGRAWATPHPSLIYDYMMDCVSPGLAAESSSGSFAAANE